MLSALIGSRLSYPAVLLAEQLVHQRSVPSGPLVKMFLYFYKLRLYLLPISGANMLWQFKVLIIKHLPSYPILVKNIG